MTRPPWVDYWLNMADTVAERGTCPRLKVGCVIVYQNRLLTTGYNGSAPGYPHCEDVGCLLEPCEVHGEHCVAVYHAEENALVELAGHRFDATWVFEHSHEFTVYTTHTPCAKCQDLLRSYGMDLANVVSRQPYKPPTPCRRTSR